MTTNPKLEAPLGEVRAAMRAGRVGHATDIAERALAGGLEHPHFLTLAAYRRMQAGESETALALAARAAALNPRDVDALSVMGTCLARLERAGEALAAFDRAIALAPDDVELRFGAALALEPVGELKRAAAEYARVAALDPSHAEAAARLAFLSATRGDMQTARAAGLQALALDPRQAFAGFAVALADIDDARHDEAEGRLRELAAAPDATIRATALSVLGDALSGAGRFDEACAAYAEAGETLRALHAPPPGAGETALARARRIKAYMARVPAERWSSKAVSRVPGHVFLVSFPRSGTTLLSHVLGAHPEVTALDEKRTLATTLDLAASDAGLDRFTQMSEDALDHHREAYWRRAAACGFKGTERVLVDKMPLNTVNLCLVAKLFPQAKVVFALRDPRDVVFSCFRRRFDMSRQHYELLTLKGTAVYYDAVMGLGEIAREKLALPFFDIRNEDLVADFDAATRALCGFLGIESDVALARYAERAAARDIATPGAAQIARGLTRDGIDRWRPFASHMTDVLPILAPWVARFGYGEA